MSTLNEKALTLAARIKRLKPSLTKSEAFKEAWRTVKANVAHILRFRKKDGTEEKRVVSKRWTDFKTPTGTGHKLAPGLEIFADLAKWLAGENPVITTYQVISIY